MGVVLTYDNPFVNIHDVKNKAIELAKKVQVHSS
jgi:hypothetical protein